MFLSRLRAPSRVLATLVAVAVPALAATAAPARIAAVESSAVVALDDGRRVRLSGLLTPVDSGSESKELRELAKACAATVASGVEVEVAPAVPPWDRHGRLVADLRIVPGGDLLQSRLVAAGCARVAGTGLDAVTLARLLGDESAARRDGRGVWTDPSVAVVPAHRAASRTGRFTLVSGVVRRAERHGASLYLDFGDDWRSDFTVRLGGTAARAAAGEAAAWVGVRVRVRGVVFWNNGPMVEADEPGVVERLTPPRLP